MRRLFLLALALLALPVRAQIPIEAACAFEDPSPIFFTSHTVSMFWDGCFPESAFASVPKFNGGGSLVRVEMAIDMLHEQRIGITNYSLTHNQVAAFGEDTGVSGDCESTSQVNLELPSSFVIEGHEATYPWVQLAVLPYGSEDENGFGYDDFSFVYSDPPDETIYKTLRRSYEWAGMTGSGYWTLNAHHSAQFGYTDMDGAHCNTTPCKDWWPRSFGDPYALLAGYTDQVGVTVELTYVWTYP